MTEARPIMMIEDDDGHAWLIEKNIRRSGITTPIQRFADGASALGRLFAPSHPDGGSDDPRPSLILLDLNLPDISGIDILRRIKGDPAVRRTPVIILTTTDDQLDVQQCYDLGCNLYVTKPLADQSFAHVIRQVGLTIAVMQLPESATSL